MRHIPVTSSLGASVTISWRENVGDIWLVTWRHPQIPITERQAAESRRIRPRILAVCARARVSMCVCVCVLHRVTDLTYSAGTQCATYLRQTAPHPNLPMRPHSHVSIRQSVLHTSFKNPRVQGSVLKSECMAWQHGQ